MDHFLAVLYMDFDLRDLKWVLRNSFSHGLLGEEDKKEALATFDK